jgi:hypothetical protein
MPIPSRRFAAPDCPGPSAATDAGENYLGTEPRRLIQVMHPQRRAAASRLSGDVRTFAVR